jgi:SnoaL-like domain
VPDNRTPEGAMPPLELASRVACLEARFAVLDAMAQQGTHYDARDSTSYANTFTQDAVRETYRLTEETPFLHLVGRAAIAAWSKERLRLLEGKRTDRFHTDVQFLGSPHETEKIVR